MMVQWFPISKGLLQIYCLKPRFIKLCVSIEFLIIVVKQLPTFSMSIYLFNNWKEKIKSINFSNIFRR